MKRRAFSIVEVMFAIMILGIGFIMVAAIFPVGIQQGRDAVDETTGQTIARQAASRSAMILRMIGQDANTATRDANLISIAAACNSNKNYQWIDPTNAQSFTMGSATITNGANSGSVGGGKVFLQQQMGADYQYMGETNYLTQIYYKTGVTVSGTTVTNGTMDVLALTFRDGRDSADQGKPLGYEQTPNPSPYVRTYQVAFDSKANIYSDMYIRNMDGSLANQADVTQFLGTRGCVVTQGGRLIKMSDAPTLQFGAPTMAVTWENAWCVRNDVPLIGSFHLTASLP